MKRRGLDGAQATCSACPRAGARGGAWACRTGLAGLEFNVPTLKERSSVSTWAAARGDPQTAIRASDQSRALSPFDPLLIGMLGSRAMALMRLGRHDEAADWAAKACARANAHAHIHGIAACCFALADRLDDAHRAVATLRRLAPGYRIDDFLSTHRFCDDAAAQWRRGAARIGLA